MKKIPVFFIDGFLDSGKTSFIIDTIKSDGFIGKTLLLVCEEGEVEYDALFLKAHYNVDIEYFDNQDSFDYQKVGEMIDKNQPDRIVIEMNGMWELSSLRFPREMEILQVIYFIDASTFGVYFNNMRQKFVDIISKAQVVVFTKVSDPLKELEPYKTSLKMINSKTQFMIMDEEKRAYDAFEEPLPYDLEKEVIEIDIDDFGTFYIDSFDHKEHYENRLVQFTAQVFNSSKLPKGSFIIGRKIMNCCADDIQLCGYLVKSKLGMQLDDNSWVKIKARANYEFSKEYNEEELMLNPLTIEIVDVDKEDILNLTN